MEKIGRMTKVRSQVIGKNISAVEVENISPHGIWLFIKGQEYFLSHKNFPWFKKATVDEICNLELIHNHHLHWPDLDVDLELESLKSPESYPNIFTKRGR